MWASKRLSLGVASDTGDRVQTTGDDFQPHPGGCVQGIHKFSVSKHLEQWFLEQAGEKAGLWESDECYGALPRKAHTLDTQINMCA